MTNNFKNLNDDNNLANGFTNFEGDNLDNYLGHEMIEINENYVKSKSYIFSLINPELHSPGVQKFKAQRKVK